jgi:sulfopyruvate decarboxylase TPP-binding subunit
MFTGEEITALLIELGVTHVVWLPDSALGPWETALEACAELTLVRVCREGEAWPLAAGLAIGGQQPIVAMQITGLFESGDALRNVFFDMKMPLFAIVGLRSWLNEASRDSAKTYALPILDAWGINYGLIESPDDKPKLADQFRRFQQTGQPTAILIAEGRL